VEENRKESLKMLFNLPPFLFLLLTNWGTSIYAIGLHLPISVFIIIIIVIIFVVVVVVIIILR
jgi:hypothetical protein